MKLPRPNFRRTDRGGFSLVEMIVTVAIIGILTSIGLGVYGNVSDKSKDGIGKNVTETLNQATRSFSMANWDMRYAAAADSAADEIMVLRSLQYREADGATPNQKEIFYKGPYMRNDWNPATSSSTDDWRIQWTGSSWKMLTKGVAGAGLKIDFEGRDLGTPYTFPADFKPVGSH